MPRLSELSGGGDRVRLSQVQRPQPAPYTPVDPSTVKTQMEAMDAAAAAERAGDRESAAAHRARLQDLVVAEMPAWERFAAGAGKSLADTGRGIGQLLGMVDESEVADARAIDEALMRSGWGLAGNIGGQAAQMAIPLGSGGRVAGLLGKAAPYVNAAARGAGFAAAQGTVGDETRVENAAIGGLLGAAGQGLAAGVGRIAQGVRMDDVTRGLLSKADDIGLRLGAGRLTENPMARTVLSQMERLPFSGARAVNDANQAAFSRAVGATFGASDDKITADTFRAAKGRIGAEFNRLAEQNALQVTPQLSAQLAAIKDDAARLSLGNTGPAVSNWVDDLLSKAQDGVIPGRAYQSFNEKIGKAMKAGGENAFYLGNIRDAVRSAMDDSISAADEGAWRAARQQYANLKTVEPLVKKSATGDISPAALMGRAAADNAGKVRMASGAGGEIGELARVGQRFLREAPDSGTADRLLVNAGVVGGLLGLPQTGLISPETAVVLGGLLAGNRAALGVLRNPALTRGASAPLQGAARAASAARTVPAAMGNARSRDEQLPTGAANGRRLTLEEVRRLNGL